MMIPSSTIAPLLARQTVRDDDDVHWWYSDTGRIVKWSVFLGLLVLLSAYIIGGYLHARSRLRKGLLPLAYHRWLIRRSDLARVDPAYAYPPRGYGPHAPHQQRHAWNTHRPADAYHMQDMGMPPPPVYDPSSQRPPVYSPPEGGSKVNPAQTWQAGGGQDDYAPPAGPPPPDNHVRPQGTGNTNPFR